MNPIIKQVIPVTVTDSPSPSSAELFPVITKLVLRWSIITFLRGLWTIHNPAHQVRTLFTLAEQEEEKEEGDIMKPGSALNFVIGGLLTFTAIKSQGETGFPFQTYPHTSKVAVSSILIYGLFSAAEPERTVSAQTPPSVYAVIVRLGRKGSLYILDRHPRIQNLTPLQPPSLIRSMCMSIFGTLVI